MRSKDRHLRLTGSPHAPPPEPASGDAVDQAVDEAMRRYFMRHDPPTHAYTRVLEAVRQPPSPPAAAGGGTARSWLVGVASAAAALLLADLTLPSLGVTAAQVAADTPGRSELLLLWLSSSAFARWVNESETIIGYSGILFLHTLGLAVVVGMSVVVDLRLLGAASRISVTAMRPLFRFLWLGFCVNAVSGAMLFIADAPRKAANPLFELKLALIAIAVAVTALIERRLLQAAPGAAPDGSQPWFKALAIASLAVWALAIAAGRLLAYAF
jgi:hypothetical protein